MRPRRTTKGIAGTAASVLVCVCGVALVACGGDPAEPPPVIDGPPVAVDAPPGPGPVEGDEELTRFLAGRTFKAVPGRRDHWKFLETGVYRARLGHEYWVGRWLATTDALHLTERTRSLHGAMPARRPDAVVAVNSPDGKLNVEIDGRQFRADEMR